MATKLWDMLGNMYTKREPLDLDFKEHYILNRFLALHPLAFWAASDANSLSGKIPAWGINYILWYGVPTMKKAPWKKYIKPPESEKLAETRKSAIQRIATIFGCSTLHAHQTLNLLEKQGMTIETY